MPQWNEPLTPRRVLTWVGLFWLAMFIGCACLSTLAAGEV